MLHCSQLNITTAAARLQLYTGIVVIPDIADYRRSVAIHGLLNGGDGVAVVLLGEGFALEHKVIRLRQFDRIETLRNHTMIVSTDLNTLNIGGSSRLFVLLRQPQALRRGNPY